MNTNDTFPTGVELGADTAITGLQTALPAGVTQLTVGGVTYQVTDLVKLFQTLVKPWKDLRAARAAIRQVMKERPEAKANLMGALDDLKIALQAVMGKDHEDLRKFGFTPRKPRKELSTEEKALMVAKAKMTRELRHTMGARQREEIEAETPTIEISPKGGLKIESASSSAPTTPGSGTGAA